MSSRSTGKLNVLFTGLMVFALVFTSLGVVNGAVYAQDGGTDSSIDTTSEQTIEGSDVSTNVISDYYTERTFTASDGQQVVDSIIDGPSKPLAGFDVQKEEVFPSTARTLSNVPAYSWVFGCSAVSGAMIAGYYDRTGYSKIYTGPTNSGVTPMADTAWPTWTDSTGESYPNNPLIASHNGIDGRTTRGSIDDYWKYYGSSASDPYITGSWTQHTWGTAIGDYMKTSQSKYYNTDGSSHFFNYLSSTKLQCSEMPNLNSGLGSLKVSDVDGTYGRKLFYQARGYTVTDCYNQNTDNNYSGGFSFANFQAEINAGNPVMLNLAGHTIVGIGYDTATNKVYIHDTWGNYTTSMTWGGSYEGMALKSVSIVHLKALPVTVPTIKAPRVNTNTKTPTYQWTPISGASKYQVQVYSGSTVLIDSSVSSSSCTSTLCSYKPTKTLSYTTYKWRVRAYTSAWQAYTGLVSFTVGPVGTSFVSPFTTDAAGWTVIKGVWGVSTGSYKTPGYLNYITSVAHSGFYTSSDYSAILMRKTDDYAANRLYVRGNTTNLDATNRGWTNGYLFQYSNDGYFSVYRVVDGAYTALVSWTTSSYIIPFGWNTLRVKSSGSNFEFYINNHLVAAGSDTNFPVGAVGIGCYENVSGATFYVDNVRLSTSVTMGSASSDVEGVATFNPRPATVEEVNFSPAK